MSKTVTSAIRVKLFNPDTHDVLCTTKHAQTIIDSYTDAWHAISDWFVYYNPIISYAGNKIFYITYELPDPTEFQRIDLAILFACNRYITIHKKRYS
jgi:hypothetical protein